MRIPGPATTVEAPVRTDAIRRAYDLLSPVYGWLVAPLEARPRRRALEAAAPRPGERVLEVAVGTGAAAVEILRRAGGSVPLFGVDLSAGMLSRALRAVRSSGAGRLLACRADARTLPFADASFELLFNAYMLDLIPLAEIPAVLQEFRRVLRPGGRLVLLDLTKEGATSLWERLYRLAPRRLLPYLFGGCRPVRMAEPVRTAGFRGVQREFIPGILPSEVVAARR